MTEKKTRPRRLKAVIDEFIERIGDKGYKLNFRNGRYDLDVDGITTMHFSKGSYTLRLDLQFIFLTDQLKNLTANLEEEGYRVKYLPKKPKYEDLSKFH